jgi:hypothetical protein
MFTQIVVTRSFQKPYNEQNCIYCQKTRPMCHMTEVMPLSPGKFWPEICNFKQKVLERTNLPTFITLFNNAV